jgi:hypothetical protein
MDVGALPLNQKSKTRLVVGQQVYCSRIGRAGQLLGVSQPKGACVIRLAGSNEVVTVEECELRIATWDEIRGACPHEGRQTPPPSSSTP